MPVLNGAALGTISDADAYQVFGLQFIEKVENKWAELTHAVSEADFKTVARTAHWIRGTGGTVGLPRISELALELEQAARQSSATTVDAALKRLAQCLEQEKLRRTRNAEAAASEL
jgi:two-component system sensor kinase